MAELAIAVIFLVLGWYGRDAIDALRRSWRSRTYEAEAAAVREALPPWLVRYYTDQGDASSIFALADGRRIPYLSPQAWHYPLLQSRAVTVTAVAFSSTVRVSAKYIRAREAAGQRIWNDRCLSLAGVVERPDSLEVMLGSCSYFQYVTVADELTREAVRAVRRGERGKTPFRDRAARTFSHLVQGTLDAQLAGYTVATVLTVKEKPHALIQRRSAATGVAGGRTATVPAFVANTSQVMGCSIALERQLFYIELLEELLGHDELNEALRRPTLDWVLSEGVVAELESADDGDFMFDRLGMGFDARTGEFHQAFIAWIRSESISQHLLKGIEASWEVKSLQLISLTDDAIADLLSSEELYPTSAFTLCLARRYLAHYDSSEP